MQIWCLLSLILTIIVPLLAQILSQPTAIFATTGSKCLNDCSKQGSLIFTASNLRNFGKIVLHVEEFCNSRKKLMICAESCSDEERDELAKMASLSTYICKDKIEEFRLVRECMENQEDIDGINKCSTECGHPSDATVQLDSSPAAPVNPFISISSIAQVCRTIECVMKCSIAESNKMCAGSGYLLRDIGFKQVIEANDQLQNNAFNSSSATQQLAKIYLESLPQQCIYIIDPVNYNMTFAQDKINNETKTIMSETSENGGNTIKPSSSIIEEDEMFNTKNDAVITRIFGAEFTTQTTEVSEDDDMMAKDMGTEETTMAVTPKIQDESDILTKSSITSDDVASTAESADNRSMKSKIAVILSGEAKGQEDEEEATVSSSVASISTDDRSTLMEDHEEEGTATAASHEPEKEKHEQERKEEEDEDKMIIWSSKEEETTTITIQKLNENEEERENNDEMAHLQHHSTPVTTPEMTERIIVVVNDDKDHGIDTNTIVQHTAVEQQQKDAMKQGTRERITLSILLILPLISLYLSNQ
ncbi:unnamed protein product [Cercopithifilaria johnstoni]|uniref:Chondroitin proteoglycan 4 domain-containing protein n=1 Tax=Cercopithifilaria johnstoni TaxID=2874296 RepID=A0A8J2M4E5_9BILA|nr:unnamed protein product [Cercopithifilaria johnstoni]